MQNTSEKFKQKKEEIKENKGKIWDICKNVLKDIGRVLLTAGVVFVGGLGIAQLFHMLKISIKTNPAAIKLLTTLGVTAAVIGIISTLIVRNIKEKRQA